MEKKKYVLVVDDNIDIRLLLKRSLEMQGYRVATAENGIEAQIKIQSEEKPCMVFLDLMMPVMDGWQFLEWKKTKPEVADLPVVVISAVNEDRKPEGVAGYLKKPVSFTKMLELAEALC